MQIFRGIHAHFYIFMKNKKKLDTIDKEVFTFILLLSLSLKRYEYILVLNKFCNFKHNIDLK